VFVGGPSSCKSRHLCLRCGGEIVASLVQQGEPFPELSAGGHVSGIPPVFKSWRRSQYAGPQLSWVGAVGFTRHCADVFEGPSERYHSIFERFAHRFLFQVNKSVPWREVWGKNETVGGLLRRGSPAGEPAVGYVVQVLELLLVFKFHSIRIGRCRKVGNFYPVVAIQRHAVIDTLVLEFVVLKLPDLLAGSIVDSAPDVVDLFQFAVMNRPDRMMRTLAVKDRRNQLYVQHGAVPGGDLVDHDVFANHYVDVFHELFRNIPDGITIVSSAGKR